MRPPHTSSATTSKRLPVEKVVLCSGLLVLAAGAAWLAFLYPAKKQEVVSTPVPTTVKMPDMPADLGREDLGGAWIRPVVWSPSQREHALFASEPVIHNGKQVLRTRVNTETPFSGQIPIRWIQTYGLDLADPDLFKRDPDKDGFINELEFEASTNPVDPASHPPYLTRLRLRFVQVDPCRVTFRSANMLNQELVFQVEVLLPGSEAPQTSMLKMGDKIPGTAWKLAGYKEIKGDVMSPTLDAPMPKDRSRLRLQRDDIDRAHTLVRGQEGRLDEVTAYFIMLLPNQLKNEQAVRLGEGFSMDQVPDVEYVLLSADTSGAVIQTGKNGERVTIPVVTEEEELLVPGGSGADRQAKEEIGY